MEKAKTFYTAAESHRSNNLFMSAFMLHQATELCLRALSRSLSGQEKTTHGIRVLLRFSLRYTTKLNMLMDNGEAEDDLNILFENIKAVHVCAEETFSTWMEKYKLLIDTTSSN